VASEIRPDDKLAPWDDAEQIPESWKPAEKHKEVSPPGDWLEQGLPGLDTKDPAQLEAWHGSFGFFNHYRKIVLANCREIVRATLALHGQKAPETRIDDLARLHNNYLGFLADHLEGRRLREKLARERMGA
jgi:hypothetical protein